MNLPKMILFDYGQTIVAEKKLGFMQGNAAILEQASKNPHNVKVEQVQELANRLLDEVCDIVGAKDRNHQYLEMTSQAFNRYLYDYFDIEFSVSPQELEWIFWTNSTTAKPSEHIEETLDFLHNNGIRTGVVSNIMYSQATLEKRINILLPNNHFEFVIASSEYMFRKPYFRIFDIALHKAKLPPEEVWFCGDNFHCDIEGAFNMGMQPVWYTKYIEAHNIMDETNLPLCDTQYIKTEDWNDLIQLFKGGL